MKHKELNTSSLKIHIKQDLFEKQYAQHYIYNSHLVEIFSDNKNQNNNKKKNNSNKNNNDNNDNSNSCNNNNSLFHATERYFQVA